MIRRADAASTAQKPIDPIGRIFATPTPTERKFLEGEATFDELMADPASQEDADVSIDEAIAWLEGDDCAAKSR